MVSATAEALAAAALGLLLPLLLPLLPLPPFAPPEVEEETLPPGVVECVR